MMGWQFKNRSRYGTYGGVVAALLLVCTVPQVASAQAPRDSLEEAPYVQQISRLRSQLLARSSWANLGTRCNPGALRVFPRDTSLAAQHELQSTFGRMEDMIVLLGVGRSVNNAEGRALVRTIMEWEAGVSRPLWDVASGANRSAIATGVTGEYPDPTSDKCLTAPKTSDTVTFVVPAVTDVTFGPQRPPTVLKAFFGKDAQQLVRNEFFAAHGNDSTAVLEYIRLGPVVRWRDWAVVSVNRRVEPGGVVLDADGKGGASYIMRRVAGQWRLFAISRTWGS